LNKEYEKRMIGLLTENEELKEFVKELKRINYFMGAKSDFNKHVHAHLNQRAKRANASPY